MTLFDILSFDERIIVLSDAANEQVYTWNQSLTLQCWQHYDSDVWIECDIRTLPDMPEDFYAARIAAVVWQMTLNEEHNS